MLTDTKIKALKSKNKIYRVADSHGLVLEVKPSGTKYWRYRYRFETKANMIGMGEYPIISLAQARQNRDKYKAYCGETSLEPLRGIDKITTFTGVIIVAAIVIIVAIASIVNSFEVVLDSVIS